MADEIQEIQTPQYEYNGELYDLNSLRSNARTAFDAYISRFSKAHKIQENVWNAVNNLINGLLLDTNGNSRVYYDSSRGQFVDSLGEYRNTAKRRDSTDAYGYAVGFLNGIIDKSNKIQPKEETPKKSMSSTAMWNAIASNIAGPFYTGEDTRDFNPYLESFINLDKPDNTGARNNLHRSAYLQDILTNILKNFDTEFQDYDIPENSAAKYKQALQKAIDALDGGITEEEMLTLLKVAPLLKLLLLNTSPKLDTGGDDGDDGDDGGDSGDDGGDSGDGGDGDDGDDGGGDEYTPEDYMEQLEDYLLEKFGEADSDVTEFKLNTDQASKVLRIVHKLEEQNVSLMDILNILNNFDAAAKKKCKQLFGTDLLKILGPAFHAYLSKLHNPDAFDTDADGISYLVPGRTAKNKLVYGIGFNPETKKYKAGYINGRSLKKATTEATDTFNAAHPELFRVWSSPSRHKNGGILKASKGSILKGEEDLDFGKIDWGDISSETLQELLKNTTWDSNMYTYTVGEDGKITQTLRDIDYLSISTNGTHYKPETNLNFSLVQKLLDLNWYKDLLKAGYYNEDYAEQYATHYRAHSRNEKLKDNYKKWFKNDGEGNFDWEAFKKDMYEVSSNNEVKLQPGKLWNDFIAGVGHDSGKGKVYVYQDEDGNVHYTNNTDGWTVGEIDIMNGEGPIAVYQLTKQSPENSEDDSSDEGTPDGDEEGKRAVDFLEDGIGPWSGKLHKDHNKWGKGIDWNNLSSLPINIAGNRRVYDTAKEGIKPALQAAPYAWNRVYGNYPAVLLANQLAALLDYQTWRRSGADQALNMAAYLSANEKGNAAVNQAQQLDYAQITSTLDRNLQTQNQNNQQRVATANANMAAINKANKEKADLKAQYLRTFYDSLENAINDRKDEYKENKDTARALAYNQYAALLQKEMDAKLAPYQAKYAAWKAKNPGSLMSDWEHYADYKKIQKELGYAMSSALNNFQAQLYGYNLGNLDYSTTHVFDNVALPTWKRGGKLILRRMKR